MCETNIGLIIIDKPILLLCFFFFFVTQYETVNFCFHPAMESCSHSIPLTRYAHFMNHITTITLIRALFECGVAYSHLHLWHCDYLTEYRKSLAVGTFFCFGFFFWHFACHFFCLINIDKLLNMRYHLIQIIFAILLTWNQYLIKFKIIDDYWLIKFYVMAWQWSEWSKWNESKCAKSQWMSQNMVF